MDRGGGIQERLTFGEVSILIRQDAASSGGAMTVFEELPPMADTPLHVHSREDELFYVLDGDHVVQRGEQEFTLGPGDSILLPRGLPHSQRRVVPGAGHLLVVCAPAGLEEFFRELAAADRDGRLGREAYAAASERAGITWL